MKKLLAREEEIMGYFWEKGPLYVKQIVDFYADKHLHFNTISTFVRGLEAQGYVGHKSYGKTYQYFAKVSRDEYRKNTLKSIVNKFFNNSYLGIVSSLVQEEDISLEDLKELIREVENGRNK